MAVTVDQDDFSGGYQYSIWSLQVHLPDGS